MTSAHSDVLKALPALPRDAAGPVFREPWEAQAFAMAVALQEKGVFSWSEWAETLSGEIKRAQRAGDPDDGSTYYSHWLSALETMVSEKRIADGATVHRYEHAWARAAVRTPHGAPIDLRPGDFEPAAD